MGGPLAPCLGPGWDWYSVQEPDPTIHPTPGYLREVSQPGTTSIP